MSINSVALIGLGAVGAIVAQQLQTVLGDKLQIVVDKKRKESYISKGIFINQEKMNFNYVTPDELKPVDFVIIATKNLQLEEALASIKNGVGDNTVILSLLNGISSEIEIETLYGAEKTLYGFIIDLQSINLRGNISCSGKGRIVFGEKNNEKSKRVKDIIELFNQSGIKNDNPEDIRLAMWKKYLINVTFNSLGAITRSTYGCFSFDSMKSAARKVGGEVVAVANAEGIPLTNEMLEDDIRLNGTYNPLGKCSMLQDVEAERKTENGWFCGTVTKLGKKHNIPTPYCEFLGELLDGTEKAVELKKNLGAEK